MTKPVILTGLRANNDLTIGNYFGGILPIIDMAASHSGQYQINMFVPDLHSFTTPIDHASLQQQIKHNTRLFVAAGLPLDNPDIHLYRQSYIPAHSEMTWILDCFTGMGEMSRMTQYKDKSAESNADRTTVGLFNYPVLMAADILLYNALYIPVGEDQTQHLEFARDIATRLNNKFGDIVTVPKPVTEQVTFFGQHKGLRIKDLQNPTKKMSKSDESGKGVIFLTDAPQVAIKKIMSATTDDLARVRYDPVNQPGVSNLIEILSLLKHQSVEEIATQFKDETRYGEFKKAVAEEVGNFLTEFQTKLAAVDDDAISLKLQDSEYLMNITANATLLRAQQAVGLRPKGN